MTIHDIINDVKACWNTDKAYKNTDCTYTLYDLLVAIHNNTQTSNIKIRVGYGLFPAITEKPEPARVIYDKATNTDLVSKINGIQFTDDVLIVLI